jgi:hypothetical protein
MADEPILISNDAGEGGWIAADFAVIVTPDFAAVPATCDWRNLAEATALYAAFESRVNWIEGAWDLTSEYAPAAGKLIQSRFPINAMQWHIMFFPQVLLAPDATPENGFRSMADYALDNGYESGFEYFCKEVAGLCNEDKSEWGFRYTNTLTETGAFDIKYPSSDRQVDEGDYLHGIITEDLIAALNGINGTIRALAGWSWYENPLPSQYSMVMCDHQYENPAFDGDVVALVEDAVYEAVGELEPVSYAVEVPGSWIDVDARYFIGADECTAKVDVNLMGAYSFLGFSTPGPCTYQAYIKVESVSGTFIPLGAPYSLGWNMVEEGVSTAAVTFTEMIGVGPLPEDTDIEELEIELDPPTIWAGVNPEEDEGYAPYDTSVDAVVRLFDEEGLEITNNPILTFQWWKDDDTYEDDDDDELIYYPEGTDPTLDLVELERGTYNVFVDAIAFADTDLYATSASGDCVITVTEEYGY